MPAHFRISVQFLDGEFHGRGDDGETEWPPSPLRLFQALTNSAARIDGNGISPPKAAALRWLESMKHPPEILAVETTKTTGYKLYVPDNVTDLVAKKWANGDYFKNDNHPIDISDYRTEKHVRPLRLSGNASVHYLWLLEENEASEYPSILVAVARSISHLGWGINLVVADAALEPPASIETLRASNVSERWLPVETSGGSSLRVPLHGSFDALEVRHVAFLNRLPSDDDGTQFFRPVPSLRNFRVVTYRRETDLARPPYAVLALRTPDDSKFAAFDPQWRRLHLAGMLRYAASQPDFAAALGWDKTTVDAFILGHDNRDPANAKPTANTPRLVFFPLPSMEWRGEDRGHTVGAIRRVLVTVSGHLESSEFRRVVRALEGRDLIDAKTHQPAAFLRRQSDNDLAISGYIASSASWTTVTPVVLPGHDDPRKLRQRLRDTTTTLSAIEKEQIVRKLEARIERLLRKAFVDSGLPTSLVADAALEWRETGFIPGADLASRYSVPDQCRRFRRLHARVTWRERGPDGTFHPKKVNGPFCIGSGRFSGLGLFTPVE